MDEEQITAELEGTCQDIGDLADAWGVDEEALLVAVAESGEIEKCTTCGWWCATYELEIVEDEHTCADCIDL